MLLCDHQTGQQIDFWDDCADVLPLNPKTIGIEVSGGTDSAVLFFLVAEYFKHEDIKIVPITINIMDSIEWTPNAEQVVQYMQARYPTIDIMDVQSDYWARREDIRIAGFIEDFGLEVVLGGKNMAPPKEVFDQHEYPAIPGNCYESRYEGSPLYGEQIESIEETSVYRYKPLYHTDKRFTKYLFDRYNALHDLLPITRSCNKNYEPGGPTYNLALAADGFKPTEPCKRCFMCVEKKWAFGVYDFESIGDE